jgi:hypothetical protein
MSKIVIQIVEPLEELDVLKWIQSGYFPIDPITSFQIQHHINTHLPFECMDSDGCIFDENNTATHFDIGFRLEGEDYMIHGIPDACVHYAIL